ncbi:MAG: hypothetical protein AAF936_15590 [Pseudomonadota bacterium]
MSPVFLAVIAVAVIGLALATWKAPRLTSIIFWSLVATIFFTSALLMKAPGPFPEKALWLTLAVPIIWTAFQFWTYWDGKPWRVAGGLIAIAIISGIIVFVSEPMV